MPTETNSNNKGVLLINLGSPKSTSTQDVRAYLDEFLMDKRVIDVPYLLRAIIVKGFILPNRPKKSGEAYKKIWTTEGSPLVVISQALTDKVQKQNDIPIELAMRYSVPSIEEGILKLKQKGVDDILIIPLYPQHAMSTTDTVNEKVKEVQKIFFPTSKLTFFPAFYKDKTYIKALSDKIKKELETKKWDYLLFSYHSIPERHIRKSDITKSHCTIDNSCCTTPSNAHEFCYRHQCFATTEAVVEQLNLPKDKYSVAFQSKLGKDKWLTPSTNQLIGELPAKGINNLAVVIPSFVADCLETLEEIALEGKKDFMENGGDNYFAIPCLNEDEQWVATITTWINNWLKNK
ncbi:MAG: ferrochelatase [Flavobacteriales bacterium]|jgi:ferrochelatase|nr:ferrochelatase [Flavobacteriales bacterium]